MDYDRIQVKLAAKAAVRETNPRPWLVTLVYVLLISLLPFVIMFSMSLLIMTTAATVDAWGHTAFPHTAAMLLPLFLYILFLLFSVVMQYGYIRYSLKLYRRESPDFKDLFSGFSMVGRVLCLALLTFVFTFLWSLVAMLILLAGSGIGYALSGPYHYGLFMLFYLLSLFGGMAFLYNRILRYSMVYYIMMDHPSWSALDCLNESKRMMAGRRWSYVVLNLSFIGWYLIFLAVYLVFAGIGIGYVTFSIQSGTYISQFVSMLLPLGIILMTFLLSAPLLLWLTPYVSASCAGFYDCGIRRAPPPPVQPKWTPPPDDSPAGSYYRGFSAPPVTPDALETPSEPEGPPPEEPEAPLPEEPPTPPEAPEL